MENTIISPKQKRHRKFLLVLPLLAFPFVTMAFWTMGGGTGPTKETDHNTGLNTNLPAPDFKNEQQKTKMELYALADRDSLRRKEQLAKDPFYKMTMDISLDEVEDTTTSEDTRESAPEPRSFPQKKYRDPNKEKVMKKLAELNKALNSSVQAPDEPADMKAWSDEPESADARRLNAMMMGLQQQVQEKDPQMEQMEAMLDKIIEIQHPERVAEQAKELSLKNKQRVYPVGLAREEMPISLLESKRPIVHRSVMHIAGATDSLEIPVVSFDEDSLIHDEKSQRQLTSVTNVGFYGLSDNEADESLQNAIEAKVAETQTLVTGATLKLELLNDCYIGGIIIKSGQFVYGRANLNGERLEVNIPSVRTGKNIMPVSMQVYDMDGLAGIYMPGAISRDVAKNSAEQAVQGINFMSYDPSLASQATSAGITAAKALFSKKARLVRVTVKAGYKVMLRDNNQSM
jgi:conjugative transposon TraM protein